MDSLQYWLHYTNAPERLIEWTTQADMLLAEIVLSVPPPPCPADHDIHCWLSTLPVEYFERIEHEVVEFMAEVFSRTETP